MITLKDTPQSMAIKLSQSNLGAFWVIVELLKSGPEGILAILDADDMGLKGPAIWIGFRHFAGEDIGKFKQALRERSPEMIAVIQREGYAAYSRGQS